MGLWPPPSYSCQRHKGSRGRGCSVEYYSKVDESARESHWQSAEIEPNMQIVHQKGPLASATRKYNQRGLTFSKGCNPISFQHEFFSFVTV